MGCCQAAECTCLSLHLPRSLPAGESSASRASTLPLGDPTALACQLHGHRLWLRRLLGPLPLLQEGPPRPMAVASLRRHGPLNRLAAALQALPLPCSPKDCLLVLPQQAVPVEAGQGQGLQNGTSPWTGTALRWAPCSSAVLHW